MKRLIVALLLVSAGIALAQMDAFTVSTTLVGTNSYSRSQKVRGYLEGVWVDVADNKTNAVLISMPEGTIFQKQCTSDAFYPILTPAYSTSGTPLTHIMQVTTGDYPNVVYTKLPISSLVTIRVTGQVGETGTNAVTVKLIYKK